MTKTLTTEAMQEIYESAVHSEAIGDDQDAHFELLCKLEDVGGTGATIRKLIDMVRAANREAQPVAIVESSAYVTAAQIIGDEPPMKAVKELYEGALVIGQHLYTAPQAPAVVNGRTAEGWMAEALLQKSVADALRKSFPAVPEEAKVGEMPFLGNSEPGYVRGWNACRAAMLAQPVSQSYKLVPVEPTEEMIAAAMNCDDVEFNSDETFCVNFDNIYRAMLAAAPEGGN
ncbi:hypothetical protein [Serratia liquefaciens]|uniref:hypothetical protein n=1 Tax=Serratia liquefaciens TaxID=614 RepID=UPI001F2A6A53|nr:hypothetical protein [Serratia liquefaciens]MCE9941749.1 hypothetical protein [Serratia liquefaciens]